MFLQGGDSLQFVTYLEISREMFDFCGVHECFDLKIKAVKMTVPAHGLVWLVNKDQTLK